MLGTVKMHSKLLDRDYWLTDGSTDSKDGLPSFTRSEIQYIQRNKSIFTKELMEDVFARKLLSNGSIFEMLREWEIKENVDTFNRPAYSGSAKEECMKFVENTLKTVKKSYVEKE